MIKVRILVILLIVISIVIGATVFFILHYQPPPNCSKNCSNKKCGEDDGCNGICQEGRCDNPKEMQCIKGKCQTKCNCKGNTCGTDPVCNSINCGTCDPGFSCEEGECVKCNRNCDGKTCGDDKCGGQCQCDTGYNCSADFQCVKIRACSDCNTLNEDCFQTDTGPSCISKIGQKYYLQSTYSSDVTLYVGQTDNNTDGIKSFITGDKNNAKLFEVYEHVINRNVKKELLKPNIMVEGMPNVIMVLNLINEKDGSIQHIAQTYLQVPNKGTFLDLAFQTPNQSSLNIADKTSKAYFIKVPA